MEVIRILLSWLFLIHFMYIEVRCTSKPMRGNETRTSSKLEGSHDEEKHRRLFQMAMRIKELPVGNPDIHNLNVAYNDITSVHDYELYNKSYTGLRKLYVHQNSIKHVGHHAFRGIKHLKHIDLSYNQIKKINSYTFVSNNKLSRLIMSNNLIRFEKYETFLLSHSIEYLVLAYNDIDQIFDLTFLGVPNLKSLILNNNELHSIAPNSFKSLNKLQYLSIVNTGVYRLSESMFSLIPRTLNLEGTPLAIRFEPPLKKVSGEAVVRLIGLSKILI
ncbi:leucine-rich repeats and immunoglobulin-like domains protein 2 [Agrilus planipennis]|uniref:Leucine-rich repeats and immunoglobulin-like domains protein 2 n=1 Tax=Agrilus planipennis TaxID=224129 RepID=A0A1W4WQX1_AGRPL|nr:leucine-rich repeats and immunoglobulin-like domains protein 2 [Agrilus planipennis]